ncbi:hypothetical protein ACIBCB_09835 [Streptomyces uncialis]
MSGATAGGIFAFSRAEPSPGAYGPQPMHGNDRAPWTLVFSRPAAAAQTA